MRKTTFIKNNYYHIFNRGVDKRALFLDKEDTQRFFQGMQEFNTVMPIGSIYELMLRRSKSEEYHGDQYHGDQVSKKLVEFVSYCLNPNHFHFILKPISEKGIEKFMHRLGLGYVMYFNKKYKRAGSLFQGPYKGKLIDSNEYLLHLSAYVSLNDKVHKSTNEPFEDSTPKLIKAKSSWNEYLGNTNNNFCNKEIILNQFKNKSDYEKFSLEALKIIKENKMMRKLLME